MKVEFNDRDALEEAKSDRGVHRVAGCGVTHLRVPIVQWTDVEIANFDDSADISRMNVEEKPVWRNPSMCAAQGIDHALSGQSSQRPREQDDVNALRHEIELIDAKRPRVDSWKLSSQLPDRVRVRINGNDRSGDVRVTPGQASIAAANLKDATGRE